jgi:hypothetical protein
LLSQAEAEERVQAEERAVEVELVDLELQQDFLQH